MANKNVTLQDTSSNNLYPLTFDFNVYNSSNQSLDNVLANMVKSVAGYTGNVTVTQLNNVLIKNLVSPNYDNVYTIGAGLTSTTYTPTKNGWIWVRALSGLSDGTYTRIKRATDSGTEAYNSIIGYNSQRYNQHPSLICPVRTGDTYYLYRNAVADYGWYFVPNE